MWSKCSAKLGLGCAVAIGCAAEADDGDAYEAGADATTAAADDDDDAGPSGDPSDASADASADGSDGASSPDDDGPPPTTGDADTGGSDDGSDSGTFPEPVPDDCITDVGAGHHEVLCDGLTYDVEVPDACLEMACGMIFDVHGYTMSAQMQDANTGLRALGQQYGYIVVQPNAEPDPPLASWNGMVDDPKVFDFMQRVAAAWHVDAARWHFTGFSQGGYMSWRFICDHADVLASVAPGAACGDSFAFGDCSFSGTEVPSEPLDILYMHGHTDALVNFSCALPRRDAVIAHYGLGDEQVVSEGEGYRWTRHESDEVTLEFIQHDYAAATFLLGGHCYPGSHDESGAPGQLFSYACVEPTEIAWGEAVMAFFMAHPKG